jgi:two-component system, chemotaxis family, protein-glutamate methylesterase/glutaminase
VAATSAPIVGFAGFDAVLIAASQGGLDACGAVLSALPSGFPSAVVYAQHRSPDASGALASLLRRRTALEVLDAQAGAPLAPGTLTVARADTTTRITAGRQIALEAGEPGVHLADDLFASAAEAYGRRLLAVVLTGRLHDGTAGVQAVKRHGGRVIVQDPETAAQPSMPWNALATGCVDLVLDLPRIADALVALVTVPGAAELFDVRGVPWASGSPSAL